MRIKMFLKKLVSIGVAAVLAVTLAGCFDLGNFNDEAAYYAAFGDVKLVYQNPNAVKKDINNKDYSIKDYFYNKNTGNNFTYGDPKDEDPDEGKDIPQLPYVYMVIPVKEDLKMDSVSLYCNAQKTCSLDVFFYVVDDLPDGGDFTKIRLLGEPEYQQKLENGQTIYEKIDYSDPEDSLIVARTTVYLKNKDWVSFTVNSWHKGNTLEMKKGQFMLLRFVNNSGANTTGSPSVAFRVTNLLIRAVS